MNSLLTQIWLALLLDFLLGDPRCLPHPVRLMGTCASKLEDPLRRLFPSPRLAGMATVAAIVGGTALSAWGLLATAREISSLLENCLSVLMLYTTFAGRDLSDHARRVLKALQREDLPAARQAVSHMVGRDTKGLDEEGIVRATVESVAENSVDGVLAPLFFAFLFGPVGGMAYKAASTLDSMFGYKTKRYLFFGWASARLDDVANFIPARLSLLFISIGALFSGNSAGRSFSIGLRDHDRHASPNSGYPEAAFAGALGVQLGGPVLRNGIPQEMPRLGDPLSPLCRRHIPRACALMAATVLTAALFTTVLRLMPLMF